MPNASTAGINGLPSRFSGQYSPPLNLQISESAASDASASDSKSKQLQPPMDGRGPAFYRVAGGVELSDEDGDGDDEDDEVDDIGIDEDDNEENSAKGNSPINIL